MNSRSMTRPGVRAALLGTLLSVAACSSAGDPPTPVASSASPVAATALDVVPPVFAALGGAPPRAAADLSSRRPEGIVNGTYPGSWTPVNDGGPVLTGPVTIFPIFYGNSWTANYKSTVMSFLQQMSTMSYWEVVRTAYSPTASIQVAAPANIGIDTDIWSLLDSASMLQIIQSTITGGTYPLLSNAIYIVYTGGDVGYSDPSTIYGGAETLCVTMGGYHGSTTFTGASGPVISQFALIGNSAFCDSVGWQPNPPLPPNVIADWAPWQNSVNGTNIDYTLTATLHEIAEAVTDPRVGTMTDGSTANRAWSPEIGDICTAQPGPLSGPPYYDLGGGAPYATWQQGWVSNDLPNKYLVQTFWDWSQNACAYGPASFDAACVPETEPVACGNSCGVTAPNGCAGGTVACTCSGTNVCSNHVCCPAGETWSATDQQCEAPCPVGRIHCAYASGACTTPLACNNLGNGGCTPAMAKAHQCS